MAASQLLKFYERRSEEELLHQLDLCPHVTGRIRQTVESYLLQEGIYSLSEVDEQVLYEYRDFVLYDTLLGESQIMHYSAALEQFLYYYWQSEYTDLIKEIEEYGTIRKPMKNKVSTYLMLNGVHHLSEIDFQIRQQFEHYMIQTGFGKMSEYVKVIDWLKLYSIKQDNEHHPLRKHRLYFKEDIVYLGYHPDFAIAQDFYYLRDKTELIFDFSLSASLTMKRQIFDMLNYVLEKECNRKNRRERYLVPLKKLYLYCVQNKVNDLELLEIEDIDGFRKSMDGTVGTKTNIYMQIVDNIRKFLFLSAEKTNWQANVWYMERFHFKGERMNPAEPVEAIHFYLVRKLKNRQFLKAYMRYLIGIGGRAINSIRAEYYNIYHFLVYCDTADIDVEVIGAEDFDEYVKSIDSPKIQAITFNRKIIDIARFFRFLLTRRYIERIPFVTAYYLKKQIPIHHERFVPEEIQEKLLAHLKYFPEHLRLMYLHLWCTGLRVNEVCTIKGDAYFWKGQDAWLKIYQYKMKTEKMIPIPKYLYVLMEKYISEKKIGAGEFVFKSANGKAYLAATFCKQIKALCRQYDISCGDYIFRSHDYRHVVGTKMYHSGTSIQGVRDYLGHKEEDMTKQYIDFMPEKIDKAGGKFFSDKGSLGAGLLQRRKGDKHGK